MRYEPDFTHHAQPGAAVTLEIVQVAGCPGADLLAVSCRLYPDEHGRPGRAPTAAQLRAVLGL